GINSTRCFMLLHPAEMDEAGVQKAINIARRRLSYTNLSCNYSQRFSEQLAEQLANLEIPRVTEQIDRVDRCLDLDRMARTLADEVSALYRLLVLEQMQGKGLLPEGAPRLRDIREREGVMPAYDALRAWEKEPGN